MQSPRVSLRPEPRSRVTGPTCMLDMSSELKMRALRCARRGVTLLQNVCGWGAKVPVSSRDGGIQWLAIINR